MKPSPSPNPPAADKRDGGHAPQPFARTRRISPGEAMLERRAGLSHGPFGR